MEQHDIQDIFWDEHGAILGAFEQSWKFELAYVARLHHKRRLVDPAVNWIREYGLYVANAEC